MRYVIECFSKGSLVILFLMLAGCAGSNFARQPDKALVFGQTTRNDIVKRMGAPQIDNDTIVKYGRSFRRIAYFYSVASAPAIFGNAEKVQEFYFYKGKLCGYDYKSSYKADHTDFDASKVKFIMKGHDRRADVVAVLGHPANGKFVYPLTQKPGETSDVYVFSTFTVMPRRRYSQTLIVTYNAKHIASDIKYTQQGKPWKAN